MWDIHKNLTRTRKRRAGPKFSGTPSGGQAQPGLGALTTRRAARMAAGLMACFVLLGGCNGQDNAKADLPIVAPPLERVHVNAWTLQPERRSLVEAEVKATDIPGPTEIPFVTLRSRSAVGKVVFDIRSRTSQLRLAHGPALSFPIPGVPVALQDAGRDRYLVLLRAMPLNTLWLVDWRPSSGATQLLKVEREGVDYMIFRAAMVHDDTLHLVIYDQRTERNYLRRYQILDAALRPIGSDVELPTLEDPAGTHYEMEPPLFLFPAGEKAVRILGGTLDATVEGGTVSTGRLSDCEKVLEAIPAPGGVAVLCRRKVVDDNGAYLVHEPGRPQATVVAPAAGIPWQLSWNATQSRAQFQSAKSANAYAGIFEHDMEHGQNSGMLDLGSDNIAGRVPWSQLYYLNGLLDVIHMARRDDKAYDVFFPLLRKIRTRLEIEMRLLDQLLQDPAGLHTRGFTVDRSPALFAVQTSRVLLLLLRYQEEFPDARPLVGLDRLRARVRSLDGHIDVLADSGEDARWIPAGRRHLRWPRGSAFYFDGLAVPYNHQNEWAYSVFEAARNEGLAGSTPTLEPQREIIRHFLAHLAPDGRLPALAGWYYWWGHAYDGYDQAAGLSVNMPSYRGDKSLAWISFRTIDLMSVLSALPFMPDTQADKLRASARQVVQDGAVYPFAARSVLDASLKPGLRDQVAWRYARAGPPWELSSSPWALAMLPTEARQ